MKNEIILGVGGLALGLALHQLVTGSHQGWKLYGVLLGTVVSVGAISYSTAELVMDKEMDAVASQLKS